MNTPIHGQGRPCVRAGASTRGCMWVYAIALVPLLGAFAVSPAAFGKNKSEQGAGLAGSWSGGGWVSFSNGNRERASCRASYSRAGADSYNLQATCATSSGKASQSATVYKVTGSAYRGSFYNTEWNIRGTIRVVIHGSSQSVSLAGEGASASLSLRKR